MEDIFAYSDENEPIINPNASTDVLEASSKPRERRMVISANSARELTNIINRYIDKYGGQTTLSELLDILDTDCLVLN